jgi:DNA polymerase III delta prime subunit
MFYETKKVPHIIFHGSSGTGKRTIVYQFLDKIYQNDKQKLKMNVMTVNCAHGKGIKFIREDLKFFAKTNIQSNSGVTFKTIVLFNADFLTIDAQSALRRCIELFSHNTRFFIVVENKHKLLNPILSRFCEIYVPEHISGFNEVSDPDSGKIVNLHQHRLERSVDFTEYKQEKREWIANKLTSVIGQIPSLPLRNSVNFLATAALPSPEISQTMQIDHIDLVNLATEMYEHGLSCLDLIDHVEHSGNFLGEQSAIILMCFHKIKSEFRNEKLLLFYLLDFIYLRSNKDIKSV